MQRVESSQSCFLSTRHKIVLKTCVRAVVLTVFSAATVFGAINRVGRQQPHIRWRFRGKASCVISKMWHVQ
jgi:hypothetical protein